jgi:hypothetical protein
MQMTCREGKTRVCLVEGTAKKEGRIISGGPIRREGNKIPWSRLACPPVLGGWLGSTEDAQFEGSSSPKRVGPYQRKHEWCNTRWYQDTTYAVTMGKNKGEKGHCGKEKMQSAILLFITSIKKMGSET